MYNRIQEARPNFLRRRSSAEGGTGSLKPHSLASPSVPALNQRQRMNPPPIPPRNTDAHRRSLHIATSSNKPHDHYRHSLSSSSPSFENWKEAHPPSIQQRNTGSERQLRPITQLDESKPPTNDRLVQFSLQIPNGVRNTTQYPEDTIVGSVSVTLTKPTKALRISLQFLGQMRVYLRESAPGSPITLHAKTDYTLFDKWTALWGHSVADDGSGNLVSKGQWETLPPGTTKIPFSIKIPRVNYPPTIKRDKLCKVKYTIQAFMERPGKITLRSVSTHPEEIMFEPIEYPREPRAVLPVDSVITLNDSEVASNRQIAVHIYGGLSKLPVVCGDRVLYKLDSRVVSTLTPQHETGGVHEPESGIGQISGKGMITDTTHTVRSMSIKIIECYLLQGMIKGVERKQSYKYEILSHQLSPNGIDGDNNTNTAPIFAASGFIGIPVDLCPFESKLLKRWYELCVECKVVEHTSLLGRITRPTIPFTLTVPLGVSAINPDEFPLAAYTNAYTDDSLNISSIAPPYHHFAAGEPSLKLGGWEEEVSYTEWDKNNPIWKALIARKYKTPVV